MIDESRFQRLEDKVDRVDDKVDGVKVDIVELKGDIKSHMEVMSDHVAGDKKIIDELQPVLAKLPQIVEMAEKYEFSKQLRKRTMKVAGAIALFAGIAASLIRLV